MCPKVWQQLRNTSWKLVPVITWNCICLDWVLRMLQGRGQKEACRTSAALNDGWFGQTRTRHGRGWSNSLGQMPILGFRWTEVEWELWQPHRLWCFSRQEAGRGCLSCPWLWVLWLLWPIESSRYNAVPVSLPDSRSVQRLPPFEDTDLIKLDDYSYFKWCFPFQTDFPYGSNY